MFQNVLKCSKYSKLSSPKYSKKSPKKYKRNPKYSENIRKHQATLQNTAKYSKLVLQNIPKNHFHLML